jgi:hypothetical protein
MATLIKEGVQTLKIFENDHEQEFIQMMNEFPEYKKDASPCVLGGFGAFGNPSSFHHPLIKNIRKQVFDKLIDSGILQEFLHHFNYQGYSIEVLFDRVMHRYPKQKPSAETAHRDVTPTEFLGTDDIIFGGWVNLSKNFQYFSYLPESHLNENSLINSIQVGLEGFNKINEYELINFKMNKQLITIKPGEMIIFPQHIIHEVLAKGYNYHQYRLFLGWRLTKSNTLLFKNKGEAISELGVPLIPSGQKPPICSPCHYMFKNKTFNWISKDYPKNRGTLLDWFEKSFNIHVTRFIDPLKFYNLPFEEYSDTEIQLMMTLHPLN